MNKKFIYLLIVFILISFVSAEDRCCRQDNNDVICIEYDINEIDDYCDSENIHLGLCDELSECKIGCCIDDEGICTSGSTKVNCENNGGIWKDDRACNVRECQKGCCSFGGQAFFTTEKNCEIKADFFGASDIDFQYGMLERECILSVQEEESGACILNENNCIFTKELDCLTKQGDFYIDYLCSNPELNTSCEKQTYTKCVDGQDEVYWFDSCGNKENIYDMDKDKSWNNGMVLSKSDSCVLDSGNRADCGNCNHFENTMCNIYRPGKDTEPSEGDYVCRDWSCNVEIYNTNVTKQNGESWCEYDRRISAKENETYARSPVGSRHFRHVCVKGEERIEPCSDYRTEICVQQDIYENGTMFTDAECITNNWKTCLNFNMKKKGIKIEKACNENPFCFYKKGSLFDMCLPKYPSGFDLREAVKIGEETDAEKICDIGSTTCLVIYQRNLERDWECKLNCHCQNPDFVEEMNEFCISLGDCGGYVNYNGEYNDEGYTISGAQRFTETYTNEDKPVYGESIQKNFMDNKKSKQNIETEEEYRDIKEKEGPERSDVYGGGIDLGWRISSHIFHEDKLKELAKVAGWEEAMRQLGIGDTKKEYVKFTCMPWQPVDGGLNCDLCNGNPEKPCSVYRCESLGKTCEFVNEGTRHELCIDNNPDDNTAPEISFLESALSEDLSYEITADGVNIIDSSDERNCLQAFTEFSFGIQTNEVALCKVSDISVVYDSDLEGMPEYFGGSNFLEINHTMDTTIQSIQSLSYQYEVFTGNIEELYGDLRYYIRCKDANGNSNFNEYVINMCVKPGPDLTPPYIKKTEPESDSFIAYNQTEQDLSIWLNEPADCKYDSKNKDYNEMNNSMICLTEWDAKQAFGWKCFDTLSISPENSSFYIKCKDSPWLPETNESRNTMDGQVYNLIVSSSELSIVDFKPDYDKTIYSGVEPVTIELKVQTSGGAEDGKAKCKYNFLDNENYNDFLDTNSVYHEQIFSSIMRGRYNINLKCMDVAGNIAKEDVLFKVKIDKIGPRIIRVYYDGGLRIITNENAECRYSFNKYFDWENAFIMSGDELEHTGEWKTEKYYIQCIDEYENKGGKMIIKPFNII